MWSMTHRGWWTLCQNFRSLACNGLELWYSEDISTMDHLELSPAPKFRETSRLRDISGNSTELLCYFQNRSKTPQKASKRYQNVQKAPENSTEFLQFRKNAPKNLQNYSQIAQNFYVVKNAQKSSWKAHKFWRYFNLATTMGSPTDLINEWRRWL